MKIRLTENAMCDHENGTYDIKRSEAEIIEM